MTTKTLKVTDVVYREDLYPRIKPDPATIQRYAESLDVLPPIEVNQHNELIDGYHRWTAHKLAEVAEICADVTVTASDANLLALAIQRNAAHGLQLSQDDKRRMARQLFAAKTYDRPEIQKLLSVSTGSLSEWLSDIEQAEREERKRNIHKMWLACHTSKEIAAKIGKTDDVVDTEVELYRKSSELKKNGKVLFLDEDFQPPIYNVWSFAKKTNDVSHFGNTEQRIVENLLWLYTEPFDIVVDPFGGGGSTIDVCQRRLRRYWVSDRKPTEARNDIRLLDVAQDLPPLNNRWSDVALTYLDPPYWRQAAGKYSTDAEDLANMPLDQFTKTLADVVKRIAAKQSKGVIALIIQPTQWNSDERRFSDHVVDLINAVGNKRLEVENRVSCPYSTEQCNPQMVEWAKANKKLLVLSRELIIWRVKP